MRGSRGALNCQPKATNKKQNILTNGSVRVQWRSEVSIRGVQWSDHGGGGEENCGYIVCENRPSWNLVDDSNPVVTAAATAESHESNLVQGQGDLVGYHVVLNVVCNALAKSLNGKAEQSALDRNAVPS